MQYWYFPTAGEDTIMENFTYRLQYKVVCLKNRMEVSVVYQNLLRYHQGIVYLAL